MYRALGLSLLFGALLAAAGLVPTKTTPILLETRAVNPSNFVTVQDGKFFVNGSEFKFVGTNAYWLPTLNSDEDMDSVLANMSAAGIKVVRTWAFNDVDEIPVNGTWFQLIQNEKLSVNLGPNGLQKLDRVIQLAQNHGIYVLLTLTNNWNPRPLTDSGLPNPPGIPISPDITSGTNNSLPRNTLSNDFGGMDTYIRQFKSPLKHDQFYTNETLIAAFMNYTTQIVSRYKDTPNVLSWEIANDPRCNSTIPSEGCTTNTITKWHSIIAQHIKTVDNNHIVSTGHQGFFCTDCTKLFAKTEPPAPLSSPTPGKRRRAYKLLTREIVLKIRRDAWKKTRNAILRSQQKANSQPVVDGVRIRGRWQAAQVSKRQENPDVGSAFDGSLGIDSEDIGAISQIGFNSFQLFPDQNSYGAPDPSLSSFENNLQSGVNWIKLQAQAASAGGKPIVLVGFGLVTTGNLPNFVPFNSSVAPFQNVSVAPFQGTDKLNDLDVQSIGATDPQLDQAYSMWFQAGEASLINGMIQYQWGSGNLTTQPGTSIGISPSDTTTGVDSTTTTLGISPNDGYSTLGLVQQDVQNIISQAAQQFNSS